MFFTKKNRSYISLSKTIVEEDTFSLKEIALMLNMKISFQQRLLDIVLEGAQFENFKTLDGKEKPFFHRVQKSITARSFRLDKEGFIPFVNKYQETLEALGVDKKRLLSIIYEMETISKPTDELLSLWDLSFRFAHNSKIVSKVSGFILDTFPSLSYLDKDGNLKNVFVFSKGKTGRSALYFRKEAFDLLNLRYGQMIYQAIEEFEKDTPYLDLRTFSRRLEGSGYFEPQLKKFILDNCLNDTFATTDKKGRTHYEKIFSLSETGTLSLRKEAVFEFVDRHQEELRAIGYQRLERILNESEYYDLSVHEMTLKELAQAFGHPPFEKDLTALALEKGKNFVKVVQTPKGTIFEPVLRPIHSKGNPVFAIHKDNIKDFIIHFKQELIEMGIPEKFLEQLYLGQPVHEKNDAMIEIRQMLDYLCISRENKEAANEKVRTLIDENQDLIGNTIVLSGIRGGVDFVFKNQEKMHQFIDQFQKELIEVGVRPLKIKERLGEEKVVPFDEASIRLCNLYTYYHISSDIISPVVLEKYLDETYPVQTSNGEQVEEKMFQAMRFKDREYIFYAIKKEAAAIFAKRHQKEFGIRDSVVASLEGKINFVDKTPDMITLFSVATMGRTGGGIESFYSFVEKECMRDTFVEKDSKNNGYTISPIFTYARSRNGYITLHCRKKGLPSFFEKRAKELKELGFDVAKFWQMHQKQWIKSLKEY